MGDSNNIIQGPATIFLNNTDIGFTSGPTSIRYAPEFKDVMPQQSGGVSKKNLMRERMYVSFSILEVTLNVLRIIMNQPSSNISGAYYYLGYNGNCGSVSHTLRITGPNVNCGNREFFFYEAVSMSEIDYGMDRENETAVEVEFEILKSSANLDRFGWVRNVS